MTFFQQQCLDDSDFAEGEYLFDLMPLPRTEREANLMARQFEEDASRWANYNDEAQNEDEDDEVDQQNKKDQKFDFQFPQRVITFEQGSNLKSTNLEELPRTNSSNVSLKGASRFSHLEKQKSDLLSKTPSEVAG